MTNTTTATEAKRAELREALTKTSDDQLVLILEAAEAIQAAPPERVREVLEAAKTMSDADFLQWARQKREAWGK